MTEPNDQLSGLRTGVVDALRATRDTEREVFDALDPTERDAPAADGGWSAKDIQAHLAAWRGRQVKRMAAIREGHDEGPDQRETDEVNAEIHAERAGWTWPTILADAEASTNALIAEIEAATDEMLATDRISGTILGNGHEHTLTHLPGVAARAALESRVDDLATELTAIIDRGDWPARPAAYARYNLACFRALAGDLDAARSLLRQALPAREELRTLAPEDNDLIALRNEIAALAEG